MYKILFILIIFLILYLYENFHLNISKIKYENKKITEDFKGFKILQISDYHNKRFLTKDYFIKKIKDTSPDIIVITGDIINSKNPNYEILDDFSKKAIKIAPIYYITGNHERRLVYFSKYMEKMKAMGVVILNDENIIVRNKGSEINIIGVNDISYYGKEYLIEKVNDLLDNEKLNILLSHRPEIFNDYVKTNIDLVLSGHTHGGQIKIPFIGAVYAPNQGFWPKYSDGIYKDKNTTMIISKGIGSSQIPLRLFSNPELVLIELQQ